MTFQISTTLPSDQTGTNMLNDDICKIIFDILPISDRRSFIRICASVQNLSIYMVDAEIEFQKLIKKTIFWKEIYSGFYYPLYKYTIELLYDDYIHLIPDRYIIADNRILYQYRKIYKRLGQKKESIFFTKLLRAGNISTKNIDAFMCGAAEVGDIETLEQLINAGYKFSPLLISYAGKENQLETIKWLHKNGAVAPYRTECFAAKKGHVDVFKFLVTEMNCKISHHSCRAGAEHLEIVKFICEHYPKLLSPTAASGNIDVVKFLFSQNPNLLENICNNAAKNGHIAVSYTHLTLPTNREV